MFEKRAARPFRLIAQTLVSLVALTFLASTISQDAAAAAPRIKTTPVVNTGQYREGTDQAAALFDPLVINRIDLTVPQASIDYMNSYASGSAPGSHGDYQPAKMTFTNTVTNSTTNLMDVGIRLKGGWGSARNLDQKPAFKIKLNYSVKGQSLYGLKKLTLNNMVQDNSMLHEVVGYRLFRAAGVPASRAGYVRIFLNGQNLGLHLNLETYDMVSLARRFGTTAHLYEGAYWQDIVNSQYDSMQVDEGDATVKTDLQTLAAVNTIDTYDPAQVETWFNEVQKYADLNEMLTEWATERFIAHWDGYAWQIKNNYYVQFNNQGIASILPSGIDQTSSGGLGILDANSAAQMFQNCMASAPCRSLYIGAVNKVRSAANSLNIDQMIQDVQSTISADVASDPRKSQSFDDFNWAVQDSRNFYVRRASEADNETNTNLPSNVTLSYDYPSWKPGDKLTPTTSHAGRASSLFAVVNGSDTCSINSTTGVVTVLKLGWCRVSQTVPEIQGYGASIAYFTFLPGTVAGAATITPIDKLTFGESVPVEVVADSAVEPVFTVSGPCQMTGNVLTATTGSGSCTVNVVVASDGTFTSARATATIKLVRAKAKSFDVSLTRGFTTKALPKTGTVTLVHKPLKVTGACKAVGTSLKALADTGYCTVTFAKWSDTFYDYAAQTTRIRMVSATQVLPKGITAAGTFKYPNGLQLADKSPVMTNWGQEAQFTSNANCQLTVGDATDIWAFDTSGLTCKVTLTVPKLFGLKGLTRTWILKP